MFKSSKKTDASSSNFSGHEENELGLLRRQEMSPGFRMPTAFGILVSLIVLMLSAGATFFFLTRSPDRDRLLKQGEKELANGQYAFAVSTLTKASATDKKDPKVFLELARAYVGIDQIGKAWDCISHAQQLGAGVVAEPALASDLANYYRQHGKYDKALDLLRPLAKADIPGKKAELADLDALWGDEALRNGKLELALRCWEEVRDLREGSRYEESQPRLATIYEKLANVAAAEGDNIKALDYLAKLNCISQNAKNYELAANLYDRSGRLELAIEQVRKGLSLSNHDQILERKLGDLLRKRGQELLDKGESESGLAYLQQAKSLDPSRPCPEVTLRDVLCDLDELTHLPHLKGEIWNAGEKNIDGLTIRIELYDTQGAKTLWNKENRIIDAFVPPLESKQSKPFEIIANVPVKANGLTQFKVYLDGILYKAYPLGELVTKEGKKDHTVSDGSNKLSHTRSTATIGITDKLRAEQAKDLSSTETKQNMADEIPDNKVDAQLTLPAPAPARSPDKEALRENTQATDNSSSTSVPKSTSSPEEKTMKDLEF